MFYSESDPDFSNFAINSLSSIGLTFSEPKSESDDSDFSSMVMNLDTSIFFHLSFTLL